MGDEAQMQSLAQRLTPYLRPWLAIEKRDLGRGTAFPASADLPGGLQTDDRFYRTDVDLLCFYDGAQWLTVHEYTAPIIAWTVQNNAVVTDWAIRTDFAPWITRVAIITRVDTTNNGTNYWTLNVQGVNTARSASTSIVAALTSVDTVATNTSHETAPAMTPANRSFFRVDPRITAGAPGVLTASVTVYYRLIVT